MKKTTMNVVLALAFSASTFAAMSAHAAVVNNGDTLTIDAGVPVLDAAGNQTNVGSGSWFSMDTVTPDSKIQGTEKHQISQGTKGIVIGSAQPVGEIDAPWNFGGNFGQHYTSTAVTGDTVTGLNMSGLTVFWGAPPGPIPMSGGAWNPVNCATVGVNCANVSGVGKFTWSGVYGTAYSLDYAATVPSGAFTGVKYYLHTTGVVNAAPVSGVPVPAAAWLLGSGLVGLVGVARRRKAQA